MSRNNVRGPTSALTEFLKASGITATSIAAHRQNEEAEEPVAGPSGTRDSENEEDENGEMGHAEEDEAVPRQRPKRQGRASISTAYDSDNLDGEQEEKSPPAKKRKLTKAAEAKLKAKEKAKAKKNKKNENSDNEQEDPYRALASSWGGKAASPAKPVIGNFEDCAKCKVQFTVTRYTMPAVPGPGFLCHKCAKESGNDPFKKPAAPKRKKVPAEKRTVVNFEEKRFPTLASLCIQLITKHIDDVEALGDIGAMNMDAISKALSKNRALTPKNAHLFYNATNSTLTLYDATNLPSPALETLVYLNPNITSLRLDFCGHMNDKVMSIMCSSLPSLIHLELLGPFLVRSPIWVTFFKSHPSLETFKITQSPRFDIEAMLALKKYCASTLTELRLREVGAMNDAFLDAIGSLKKVEKLDIGDPGKANECTAEALQGVLFALSGTLRVLDVSRHEQVTDSVLKEGLAGTRHMDELVARNTTLLTDMGVAEFFKTWKNQPLRRIDFGRNHDLGSAALVALIEHSGERLEELGINGWGDVETGALKMLGRLGGELRRLDVGWVREVDDFVVKGWMEGDAEEDVESKKTKGRKEEVTRSAGCTRLCEVKVWGCNKITARCPRKKGFFHEAQ
ncbi:DNA repair protein rhp7 [Termitomyces sp. T112]|nr:DNA repair protein rhp7 [Termitomyces sp. T112]